ncbi:MAG: serine hydrolase domain-containing protein, partial [Acidimicrobiales bacterium]
MGTAAGLPAAEPARFDAATFDPVVQDGIRRGAFPGGALIVGRSDTILFARGYGHFTWSGASAAVTPESTLYDLASLTKVLVTTTAVMLLVERGAIRLDAPVATYLPEFNGAGTAAITVRALLTHTSGLRVALPLRGAPDPAAALRLV